MQISIFDIKSDKNLSLESQNDNTILGLNFNILNGTTFDDVPLNGDFYWLLTCLILCIIWNTYIIYYNSRIFGLLLTKLINNFIIPRYLYRGCDKKNHPYLHIGSFSITLISGKIMFRDVVFITSDYSLRIQDGWMIFKWWVPYEPKNISKNDFSQSDTRLTALFNGFEFHLYNRSELYSHLEKVFDLPSKIIIQNNLITEKILQKTYQILTNDELIKVYLWRDFFPVTKLEINSGRIVFGNHNVPTTLLITFEESNFTYTSKPSISKYDLFTHIVKGKAQSFKIILANSLNYTGFRDEPPRFMGEGFVVFQSNQIDFYYYQDEPGFASSIKEKFELSTGDFIETFTSPIWGLDVKSGKGTDIRYGPWADRQRDSLYNFFYPLDYQKIDATEKPKEKELRLFETFVFRFSTLSSANIDILFTDTKKETNVIHVSAGSGSYLEVSVPLISKENGYYSNIVGQILHLDSTTSLAYRSLAESETLEFNVRIEYPRMWNHHQTWVCDFTGCKTSANLIYAHKIFFQSLIEDWAGKDIPDIMKFVPYTCKINFYLKEFEIILLANEYNWIDCTSKIKNENIELAICGDIFDMSFELPFTEFLPQIITYKIWIQGESLEAAVHVPEINPHCETIKLMHKYAKMYTLLQNNNLNLEDFIETKDLYAGDRKWRNIAKSCNNWITCWSVPIVAISINYNHHPIHPKATFIRDSNLTLNQLNKISVNSDRPEALNNLRKCKSKNFDPGNMDPDLAKIEIEIGPSKICLYGLLLRILWNIKENYMGESQLFSDFSMKSDINSKQKNDFYQQECTVNSNTEQELFDERYYRPFAVTVSVIMHDLHGYLIKNCFEKIVNAEDPLCPYVYLNKLCFEMDKSYRETKLQLVLSPLIIRTSDLLKRCKKNTHLNHGHLLMNSLQFRGHALFSGLGRSLESETLEYGWLVEVEIGKLSGKLTTPQMYHIICSLENFAFQLVQQDSSFQPPIPYRKCLHDKLQSMCSEGDPNLNKLCPYSEDLKYKMVRISIQSVDLCLVEKNNLFYIQVIPIKFSTCNLHSCHSNNGFTLLLNNIFIKHFIVIDNNPSESITSDKTLDKIDSSKSLKDNKESSNEDKKVNCYEALNIELGPIFVDTSESLSIVESYTMSQKKFLSIHDAKTKKLWFLWQDLGKSSTIIKCGCVGGCAFFGNNLNGQNFFNLNVSNLNNSRTYNGKLDSTLNERFEEGYDFLHGESLLNPGESLLEFKFNSIYEKSEENLDSENINDHKKKFSSTNQMKNAFINVRKNKVFTSTKSISPSCTHLKTNLTSLGSSVKSNINFTNVADASPYVNTLSQDKKNLHYQHVFSKNRSLSETGIEKKLNFGKINKPKEISTTNSNKIKGLKSSFLTNSSITTDHYFSTEDLNASNVQLSEDDTYKSMSSIMHSIDTENQVNDNNVISDLDNFKKLNKEQESKNLKKQNDNKDSESKKSSSDSSSSFVSACSTPNESDNEDIYDLRDQMERPILESSLLMSTYKNYLTVYECDNWYPKNQYANLLNSNYIPNLKQITFDGLSSITLTKKKKLNNKNINNKNDELDSENFAPGHFYERISDEFNTSKKESFLKTHKRQDSSERVINLGKLEKQICKTVEIRNEKFTVLVKINGNTEIRISPLCLDGLKTFIDSLTSTLAKAHPLTIVNHLNLLCCKNVETKNYLKKQKTLEYGQLKLKAWRSTMERERGLSKNSFCSINNITNKLNENVEVSNSQNNHSNLNKLINNQTNSNSKINFFDNKKQAATVITANQYEETKNTKFQLFIQISNINIYVLQASLVENMVESSVADSFNECTCVSLLVMNLGRANFDFCNNKKERRSLHTFITNNAQTPPTSVFAALSQKDIMSKLFPKKPKKEQKEIEPLTIETQELLQEESVGLGNLIKLHIQLNRLKNSSIINNAFFTIIPEKDGRVDFEISNVSNTNTFMQNNSDVEYKQKHNNIEKGLLRRQENINEKDFIPFKCENDNNVDNDKSDLLNGFIMFEAGIENINLNCVKKKIVMDENSKNGNQDDLRKNTKFNKHGNDNDFKTEDGLEDLQQQNSIKNSENQEDEKNKKFKNDASSLGGEINVIWFNFAAPPKTPNTKKIDFTRLDWNLISTATPAINAWLNTGDRLLISSKKCSFYHDRRVTAVLACLMSAALEVPRIHVSPTNRYWTNRLTSFSKALHEDPSCQLMAVLRRYLNKFDSLKDIEENLNENVLPPIKVLKKGVISLCRQWKNALYMPLLVEQNIKYSRGEIGKRNQSNIPLRLLINENNINLDLNDIQPKKHDFSSNFKKGLNAFKKENKEQELDDINLNDLDVDENTNLLNTDLNEENFKSDQPKFDSNDSSQQDRTDYLMNDLKNRLITSFPYMLSRSARGSLSFPILTNPLESLNCGVNKAYEFLFNPNNQNNNSKHKLENLNQPNNSELSNEEIQSHESDFDLANLRSQNYECCNDDNLYLWAIKQQDYMNSKNLPLFFSNDYKHINDYSKNCTLRSNNSEDNQNATFNKNEKLIDENIDILPGFVFMPTGIQLGDVKVIFEPLLISLNIENIEEMDSNLAFEQLGPKISLSLIVKLFKIEIVESEHYRTTRESNYLSPIHRKNFFRYRQKPEKDFMNLAAFECDYLIIGLDLRKVKDFNNNKKLDTNVSNTDTIKNNQGNSSSAQAPNKSTEAEKMPIIILGPEGDINVITTIVNFSILTNHIIQRVNLPLIRLIHQVTSVFENVKETRLIMKSKKVDKWKQNGNFVEKFLSSSFNSSKFINRQSDLSNITNKSVKIDYFSLDIDSNDKNNLLNHDENKEKLNKLPKCWKDMCYLLDLYETTPETKTVAERNSYVQPHVSQTNPTYSNLQHQNNQHQNETVIQIEDVQTNKRFNTEINENNLEESDEPVIYNIMNTPTELRKFSVGVSNNQINLLGSNFRKSMVNVISSGQIKTYTHALMQRESTPLIIFGVAKIKKVNLEAKLSGLKLDGELSSFHVSITHKEKVKGASIQAQKWKESSLTAHLGKSSISILEEIQHNNQQLVVKMSIGKSHTLVSSQNKNNKYVNSALLSIGAIGIDIPQHPVALHGMMTRSSRQLSTTLQEFKTPYRPSSSKQPSEQSEQTRTSYTFNNLDKNTAENHFNSETLNNDQFDSIQFRKKHQNTDKSEEKEKFLSPIVVQFTIFLESFKIGASLLPSLTAKYSIGQVISSGITGQKAKFTIDFREHILSFNTKIKQNDANLPSSAFVSLPLIHVSAEYMEENKKKTPSFAGANNLSYSQSNNNANYENNSNKNTFFGTNKVKKNDSFSDVIVLRKGSYLNASAEIGAFEHSLTTDLLNHLLLVQKVFMKEVNEILQKMSGYDQNVSQKEYSTTNEFYKTEKSDKKATKRYLLFNLHLTMKGIQITATTPTNSAVRLETGSIELQLSNRVQNMLSNSRSKPSSDLNLKLYFKLQVDLNVALGQLFMNPMFEEADPEFQQLAYFKTRIVMCNALQKELISSTQNEQCDEKEAVLIVLNRPLLYFQPIALDKAVLVWLNYKNAYEYWNEQRANLNTEVKSRSQQIFEKTISQINSSTIGTLFLQLTIDDLGICLPITTSQPAFNYLSNMSTNRIVYDSELKSAFVITLESTNISACSFGSWASKAKFTGLCIRFVDDFETSLDDWKPDPNDLSIMNLCVVSEGTYEICSKTTTPGLGIDAKWLLNVSWKMEGFDIHVDTSIGKQLTSLFKTLTALTGEQDEMNSDCYSPTSDEENKKDSKSDIIHEKNIDFSDSSTKLKKDLNKKNNEVDSLSDETVVFRKPALLRDTSLDTKKRSRLIEKELNDQIKLINQLKDSKASEAVIEQEIKKFNELEAFVFNDFKRDVLKKLRRQSIKKSFRDNLESKTTQLSDTASVPSTPFAQAINSNKSANKKFFQNSEKLNSESNSQSTKSSSFDTHSPLTYSLSKDNVFEPNEDELENKEDTSKQTKQVNADQRFNNSNYTIQEPNIDFELDVKIFFNSGKCVLHTKDLTNKDDTLNNKKGGSLPKDKSFSSNPYENINSFNSLYPNQSMCSGYNKFQRSSTSKANTTMPNLNNSNVFNYSTSGLKPNSSSSKLRSNATSSTTQSLDYTIFLIPGLDIKLHYNSKTVFPNSSPSTTTTSNHHLGVVHETISESENLRLKKFGTKKATCYAWMTLHSIPEETLITPHLLDFLEQALEPIPIETLSRTASENNINTLSEKKSDLITSETAQYAVYGSFPVDVIVYLHVQPSVLRFSCLPTSRMECLLRLPSVDLVFSSKRMEDELNDLSNNSNINTHKRTYSGGIMSAFPGSANLNYNKVKIGHRRIGSDYRHQCGDSTNSGLIVTGYLADFSLYIFHPYTNKKNTITNKFLNTSSSSINSSHSSFHERFSNTPKVNLDRKDSLSLQVEFVNINISRSRKLVYIPNFDHLKNFSAFENKQSNQKIVIRFSGLCDIGSASFKCDIRRSIEILDFPKAWYRKALWKRIFLGDQGLSNDILINDVNLNIHETRKSNLSDNELVTPIVSDFEEEFIQDLINQNEDVFHKNFEKNPETIIPDSLNENKSTKIIHTDENKLKKLNEEQNKKKSKQKKTNNFETSYAFQQRKKLLNTPWETLILFDVNLSKLNVHMNIGNVMGNTNWVTRGFRSDGKLLIDSNGHRSMNIGLYLDSSTLDAKSGIVGGQIELSKIDTKLNIKEFFGLEPDHVITAKFNVLQSRIDYMGTSILMMRISNLDLNLKDEWKIDFNNEKIISDHPTKRLALMFIHCYLKWDQLQILMSKSTTPDIIKIICKLDEFFSQQFHSGKRIFSSLQNIQQLNQNQQQNFSIPTTSHQSANTQSSKRPLSQLNNYHDTKHHRHWQKALKAVSGVFLNNFPNCLPKIGTILGGTFELYGNNLSLACFSGINFRSKSWALFSLRHPHISFQTEAQESIIENDQDYKAHIIQNFTLSLGRRQNQEGYLIDLLYAQHSSMATVCKISTNTVFSPQFKHLNEWFEYAFSASELDEVHRFPIIEFERLISESFNLSSSSANNNQQHQNEQVIDGLSNVASNVANVMVGVAAAASSRVQTLGETLKKHKDDYQQRRYNSSKIAQLSHNKEVIFALPSLQLELKTEHFQDATIPLLNNPKPKVDCSFVTDFDDHIFVAVDIEAYYFLHILITSYIKEREATYGKTQSPIAQSEESKSKKEDQKEKKTEESDKKEQIENDWREYNCKTWHLEPTVRLLTWAGRNIEPYGVDYILQILGFNQARTTIPKWIQRGAMDPLDKVLSELMYHNILSNRNNNYTNNK